MDVSSRRPQAQLARKLRRLAKFQDVDKVNRLPERCESLQAKEASLQTRKLT